MRSMSRGLCVVRAAGAVVSSLWRRLLDQLAGQRVLALAEPLEVRQLLTDVTGTSGDDTIHVRAVGSEIRVWLNTLPTSVPTSTHTSAFAINAGDGDDLLEIDLANSDAFPEVAVAFHGESGENRISVLGARSDDGIYRPSGSTSGTGALTIDQRTLSFASVSSLEAHQFSRFFLVTPGSVDDVAITRVSDSQIDVTGDSDGVSFAPLTVTGLAEYTVSGESVLAKFVLNTAENDTLGAGAGDDEVALMGDGVIDGELRIRAGTGINTLHIGTNDEPLYEGIIATLNTAVGTGGVDLSVDVHADSVITFPSTQVLASLNIEDESTVVLPEGGYKVLAVEALTMGENATLNLADNDMIVHTDGTAQNFDEVFYSVTSLLQIGYASTLYWDPNDPEVPIGPGIVSSSSAGTLTSLGVIKNSNIPPDPLYTTFGGLPVTQADVLVRYTYDGDTELSGSVDADDYFRIDMAFSSTNLAAAWYNGDFDYTAAVDADDYFLIDSAFAAQTVNPLAPTTTGPRLIRLNTPYTLELDPDNNDPTLDPRWTVYWGDGEVETFTDDNGPTTREHTYTELNKYTVFAAAKGEHLYYGAPTRQVKVFQGAVGVVIDGAPLGSPEGTEITLDAIYYDENAATQTFSWSIYKGGTLIETDSGPSISFIPDDNAAYQVTVQASSTSGTADDSVTIQVFDVAPIIAIEGDPDVDEGVSYPVSVTLTDPGNDPVTAAYLDWGDGTQSQISSFPANLVHEYARGTASYNLRASVSNGDGTFLVQTKASPAILAGAAQFGFASSHSDDMAVAVQPDGKIIVVGDTDASAGNFRITRLNSDGSLDTESFGPDGQGNYTGFVTVDFGDDEHPSDDHASGVVLQEIDGEIRIVVAGTATVGAEPSQIAITRLHADGSPDSSFGGTGVGLYSDNDRAFAGHAVTLQTVGGEDYIVVAGAVSSLIGTDFVAIRVDSAGLLDTDFASGGVATVPFTVGSNALSSAAYAIEVQDVGGQERLVLAGVSGGIEARRFSIARLHESGQLDSGVGAFGTGSTPTGKISVIFPPVFGTSPTDSIGRALTFDNQGRILVAGEVEEGTFEFGLIRLTASGVLDTNFDGDGRVRVRFNGQPSSAFGVAVQQDDRIVLGGWTQGNQLAARNFAAIRFQAPTGATVAVDETFGTGGWITTDVSGGQDQALAMTMTDRGRIVLAGHSLVTSGTEYVVVSYPHVVVNRVIPTMSAVLDQPEALEGHEVTFVANLMEPVPVGQLSYSWTIKLGEQTLAQSSSDSISFTPADNGGYEVILTITDTNGDARMVTQEFVVDNVPPTLTIGGNVTGDESGHFTLSISSQDSGQDQISAATIDWGDGSTSDAFPLPASGDPLEHTFAESGEYQVIITVQDEDGSHSFSRDIVVNPSMPAAPTGITAARVHNANIKVSWTDNATDERGYRVEVKAEVSSGSHIVVGDYDLDAGQTELIVQDQPNFWNGIAEQRPLLITVKAYNCVVAPTLPESCNRESGSAQVQLAAWNPPADPVVNLRAAYNASRDEVYLYWTEPRQDELLERSVNGGSFVTHVPNSEQEESISVDYIGDIWDESGDVPITLAYRIFNQTTTGYSNVAELTLHPQPDQPDEPSVTAEFASSSVVNLAWAEQADALGFMVSNGGDTVYLGPGTTSYDWHNPDLDYTPVVICTNPPCDPPTSLATFDLTVVFPNGSSGLNEYASSVVTTDDEVEVPDRIVSEQIASLSVDVDSNGTVQEETYCGPQRYLNTSREVAAENEIGEDLHPGALIFADPYGDRDRDGIPSFADGFNWDSLQDPQLVDEPEDDSSDDLTFGRMYLDGAFCSWVEQHELFEEMEYYLEYDDSPPAAVTRSGQGTELNPYQFSLPTNGGLENGGLRIWSTTNGSRDRYVASGEVFGPEDIASLGWGRSALFLVEGLTPSNTFSAQQVKLYARKPGESFELVDEVRFTVAPPVDLDIDSDNSYSPLTGPFVGTEHQERIEDLGKLPGKVIVTNDGDLDEDGIIDFADGKNLDGIDDSADDENSPLRLVPVRISIPPQIDPAFVDLQLILTPDDAPTASDLWGTTINRTEYPAGNDTLFPAPEHRVRIWYVGAGGSVAQLDAHPLEPGNDGGDAIIAGHWYSAPVLGTTSANRLATLYIEATSASAMKTYTLTLNMRYGDSRGPNRVIGNDAINFTVVPTRLPFYGDASAIGDVAPGADGGDPKAASYSGAVDLTDGSVSVTDVDLAVEGFGFPWGHTRTWTNQPDLFNPHALNGTGMIVSQWPWIVQGSTTIIVHDGARNPKYFDLMSNGSYAARFFVQDRLAYDAPAHEYILTDTVGNQIRFNDFDAGTPKSLRGLIKRYTSAQGVSIETTTADGRLTGMHRTDGNHIESFQYNYIAVGQPNAGLLESVVLVRGNGEVIQRVEFVYYQDGEPYGLLGQLKAAAVKDPAGAVLSTTYYRYYGTDATDARPGYLRFVVRPHNYVRLPQGMSTGNDDLAPYADMALTYEGLEDSVVLDTVKQQVLQVGASTGAIGDARSTFNYEFRQAPDWPLTPLRFIGANVYSRKAAVRPNGSTSTDFFFNEFGGLLLQDVSTRSPGPKLDYAHQLWFYRYDADNRLVMEAAPSAALDYRPERPELLRKVQGNWEFLADDKGVITNYHYAAATTATAISAGAASGFLDKTTVRMGELAVSLPLTQFKYKSHQLGGAGEPASGLIFTMAESSVFPSGVAAQPVTTKTDTDWAELTGRRMSMTTTLPAVDADHNGSGVETQTTEYYDSFGNVQWVRDGGGRVHYFGSDAATGAVVKHIVDVKQGSMAAQGLIPPNGLAVPTDGLHLVGSMEVDAFGRPLREVDPNGNVIRHGYFDALHESRTWRVKLNAQQQEVVDQSFAMEIVREDWVRGYTERRTVAAPLNPMGETPLSFLSLTRVYTDNGGRPIREDRYFNVEGLDYSPDPLGVQNTHFYHTEHRYNGHGLLDGVKKANGTIEHTVYDSQGRRIEDWVGTNDNLTDATWVRFSTSGTSDMIKVAEYQYDHGKAGDGNLTRIIRHPGGMEQPRITRLFHDWRNRLIATDDGVRLMYMTLDNLGRSIQDDIYDGELADVVGSTNGVPNAPAASALRARNRTMHDERGQVYRKIIEGVDQATGLVSGSLATDHWHDDRGNVIKTRQPGGLVTKSTYDGASRGVEVFSTDGGGDSTWADAGSLVGDVVITQLETTLDKNGNAVLVSQKDRYHDAGSSAGPLGSALMSPRARVSYVANFYDAANNLRKVVNHGTFGGAAPSLNAQGHPVELERAAFDGGDDYLVTEYGHDQVGRLALMTDPRGIKTKYEYDALSREILLIEAFTGDGTPTETTNKTTQYTYTALDQPQTVTNLLPAGKKHTTEYLYGADMGNLSALNSNDLLVGIDFPSDDAGGNSPGETFWYNALGEVAGKRGRNMVVHDYDRDTGGRVIRDNVTIPAAPVIDRFIDGMSYAYDALDRPLAITSLSGNVVKSEVLYQYNRFGQLAVERQRGSIPTSATSWGWFDLSMQYVYDGTSGPVQANRSRLTSIVYPDGRVLEVGYGASQGDSFPHGLDDAISRPAKLIDGANAPPQPDDHWGLIEEVAYLGGQSVAGMIRPQTGLESGPGSVLNFDPDGEAGGDGGDIYQGLDRFGRIVKQNFGSDLFEYEYDAASNLLSKDNLATTTGKSLLELYQFPNAAANDAYDPLGRMKYFFRGQLAIDGRDGRPKTLDAQRESRVFSHDAAGNIQLAGATFNPRNEVVAEKYSFSPSGNARSLRNVKGMESELLHDAWDRLVSEQVFDLVSFHARRKVFEIFYLLDALGRRISITTKDLLHPAHQRRDRHRVYSTHGQLLEERVGSPGTELEFAL